MSVSELVPNGTILSANATAVGAASLHAALASGSAVDISSVVLLDETSYGDGGAYAQFNLTDFTFPAGVEITRIEVGFRGYLDLGTGVIIMNAVINGVMYQQGTTIDMSASNRTVVTQAVPPGGWTDADMDGATLWLQGWQLGGDGIARVFGAWMRVFYVIAPVVDVTAPSGTFTTNNRPIVSWSNTLDAEGGAQTAYQVKIFSAAQYGAGGFSADTSTATQASGTRTGNATGWIPPIGLANATYRAYVRVAQTVNGALKWSAWDFLGFTVNTPAPATPNLNATADAANGRIALALTANSGSATTQAYLVQRSTDGGATWENVRTAAGGGVFVGSSGTVYDYEAQPGDAVQYRAYALHDYSGSYTPSLAAATDTDTWTTTSCWLKCPEIPALNTKVTVHSFTGYTIATRQATARVLGRRLPVIITDGSGRDGRTGSIVLQSWSQDARDDLIALLDSGRTLLLQVPPSNDIDGDQLYLRAGDLDRARLVDKAWVIDVLDTLAWTEVDPPSGPLT